MSFNFLALKIDKKTRLKLWRYWFHATDAAEFGLVSVAVILVGAVLVLWYGLVTR